jgi:hypothetical protein
MKKIIIYTILIFLVIVVGFLIINSYIYNDKQIDYKQPEIIETSTIYSDSGYVYFGNEAKGDLNGDGTDDSAFILTKDEGGSGTFYYVGVVFKNSDGYLKTNTIFLGDRIAPQTTEIRDGVVIVNYADRKKDEPMTARPSIGVSGYFKALNGVLAPVDPLE